MNWRTNCEKMRHRIILEKPDGVTRNRTGEAKPKYKPVATVWASVEPLRGNEYLEAQKLRAELFYRIRLRYYPGVTTEWRVAFKEQIFHIQSVINVDERNRELHLMVVEDLK